MYNLFQQWWKKFKKGLIKYIAHKLSIYASFYRPLKKRAERIDIDFLPAV